MDVVDFSNVDHVYIVCGRTDMRRGIDGLAGIVSNDYGLQVYSKSAFLFCGRRADRYKGLYWDGDGFMLLYKRIENGKLQWPRNDNEVRELDEKQIRWLLDGLSIVQPKVIKPANPGYIS